MKIFWKIEYVFIWDESTFVREGKEASLVLSYYTLNLFLTVGLSHLTLMIIDGLGWKGRAGKLDKVKQPKQSFYH